MKPQLQGYDRSPESDSLMLAWEKAALDQKPEDVLACAGQFMGYVAMNYVARLGLGEKEAHEQINEITNELHTYINANWREFMLRRQEAMRRRRL